MPATFIRQFIYESESWKRLLFFYREENVYYRNRLSELLSDTVSEEILERAEYFQGHFVMSDETIYWLMDEIHQHKKFLGQNSAADIQMLESAIRNQQRLKNDIVKAEEVLLKLKKEFNEFLAESVVGYYN
jgi:predicted AAA+ superfamily ATPase